MGVHLRHPSKLSPTNFSVLALTDYVYGITDITADVPYNSKWPRSNSEQL